MNYIIAIPSEAPPPVAAIGASRHARCRLCTANDLDGVVEHVAEQLWESRRRGSPDDWPWAEAGGYWQQTYRQLASAAINALT